MVFAACCEARPKKHEAGLLCDGLGETEAVNEGP